MLRSHLQHMLGLLVAVTCLQTPSAAASLLWNNGSFALDEAAEISSHISADDFTLTSTRTLTTVRFWASIYDGDFTKFNMVFTDIVGWALYADNAGMPGMLPLHSGFDNTPTLTPVLDAMGNPVLDDFGAAVVQIDIDVGSVDLAPGTYWLALREGEIGTPPKDIGTPPDILEVYWQLSPSDPEQGPLPTAAGRGYTEPTDLE